MAKGKHTTQRDGKPPFAKKARVERPAASTKNVTPVTTTKEKEGRRARDAGEPKFSLRVGGPPRPGHKLDVRGKDKGKGKGKESAKVNVTSLKGKGKAKEPSDDEDEDDSDDGAEVSGNEDENMSMEDEAPNKPSTTKSISKPTKPKKAPKPSPLPKSFKIVAGSYEKLLYGLSGSIALSSSKDSEAESHPQDYPYTFTLAPIFIFPAHVSCIKAVAASPEGGKWLATGSADEIVKVWDLRRRKEIGGLMHHEGSITHLLFPSRSHLLSASEDGSLCLFRARDWSVLRALKGHKGRVNSVAVHPSGKVALSVGKDRALRMWDLMRGKGVASTKLGKEGEIVRWSTNGEMFAVQTGSTVDIYNTSLDILHTINHSSRLHDVRFCKRVGETEGDGELLLVGAEDNLLSVYDVPFDAEKEPRVVAAMTGHENRVKAVQTHDIALPTSPSGRTSTTIVCTVSSDGKIHVYDLVMVPPPSTKEKVEISPVAVYDSKGTRLTCVTIADGDVELEVGNANAGENIGEKRKQREDEDEGDVESGDDGDGEEWSSQDEDEDEDEEEEEEEEEAEVESD